MMNDDVAYDDEVLLEYFTKKKVIYVYRYFSCIVLYTDIHT